MLDHIEIYTEVPRVDYEKLGSDRLSESSQTIWARVHFARDIQNNDSQVMAPPILSAMQNASEKDYAVLQLQNEGKSFRRAAMIQINLSARAYRRILKLTRKIADLVGSEDS